MSSILGEKVDAKYTKNKQVQIFLKVSDSDKQDHENVIKSDDQDKDSNKEGPEEDLVSFAGPVNAQGTVSVAANFGYNGE